jgi:hypothetical protein
MTSDTLRALLQRETRVWAEIQMLSRAASAGKREFSNDEQRRFNELHAELDQLDRQVRALTGYGYTTSNTTAVGGGGGGLNPGYLSGNTYVRGAGHACQKQGCRAEELEAMLASTLNVTQELLREKEGKMEPTRALWCEQGGHSFSEKDPGMQVLSITGKNKEGDKVTESRTICGPCAEQTKTNLGGARNVPASLPGADS